MQKVSKKKFKIKKRASLNLSTEKTLPKRTNKKNNKYFEEHYDLPSTYNTTNITLMVRDPYWIFAYWDIDWNLIEELKNKFGSLDKAKYVIRMYDVTYIDFNGKNANRTFDIEIDPKARNWYINLWNDNATYCADLGICFPDGRFYQLARSNFVTTPRFRPSGRSEEIWMEVKDNVKQQPFVMAYIEREEKTKSYKDPRQTQKKDYIDSKRLRRINLTEDDIKAYYSKLSPSLREVVARRIAENRQFHKKTPLYKSSIKELSKNIHLYSKGTIKDLMYHNIMKKIQLGASEELVLWGGGSEAVFSGASQQFQKGLEKRKFFFEIWTELIVYGRTEPDAEVYLKDKKIELSKDGTFSMRFALPEVKIPLDFTAKSADGYEKREISTSVERTKTIYNP